MDVFTYTSERFEYPANFSLKEYMGSSWGVINDGEITKVRLKFSPEVAHRVTKLVYHPSQVVEELLEDGSVIISFEVCGLAEMKTWIMQWGDMVEGLEPEWLRKDVQKRAKRILALYGFS